MNYVELADVWGNLHHLIEEELSCKRQAQKELNASRYAAYDLSISYLRFHLRSLLLTYNAQRSKCFLFHKWHTVFEYHSLYLRHCKKCDVVQEKVYDF